MSIATTGAGTMRTVRFHAYGEPADVLRLDGASIPSPRPGTICVKVHACGLNPADWALCRGLFQRDLPRGIGLDVSGIVSAVGEGVTDVAVGDAVLGPADYVHVPSAGASDYAILPHWAPVPAGLDLVHAAALPMVVETATRYLALFDMQAGRTMLVNGAGTMIGFGAVQMALLKGLRVIAIAGETFADRLRVMGAVVTGHGEGLVERVRALALAVPDFVLDTAPVNLTAGLGAKSALPDLVAIAGGDGQRVVTVGDFANAVPLGVRTGMEGMRADMELVLRWDALAPFATLAAEGRFAVPVARTFALEDWRAAMEISMHGRAQGKLVLLPGGV